MFKLMIISGPNSGTTYEVQEQGETTIGRHSENSVVLQSVKVSKKHCVLVASHGQLLVRDQGSSNGTFVNGVLAREKKVRVGDRISVGEFIFELLEQKDMVVRLQTQSQLRGKVLSFPSDRVISPSMRSNAEVYSSGIGPEQKLIASAAQMTLSERVKSLIDHYVMPFFYGLLLSHDWKSVCIGIFALFCLLNTFISIAPLLESNRQSIVKESSRRATYMARQIADQAAPLIAAHAEARLDVSGPENAEGVRLALVTDLESRILAPATRQNQYFKDGPEARMAVRARDEFRKGRETGKVYIPDPDTLVSVEPIRAYNAATAKNIVIGMAIVAVDTSISNLGMGDVGLVYSETLVFTALLGAIALLILYRLTIKPIEILSEDMDKSLKGEISEVTREFKWPEIDPLLDLVNAALQRIPKATSAGIGFEEKNLNAEDFVAPLRSLAAVAGMGVVICDGQRKVIAMNPEFEEKSGSRELSSVGSDITAVARDEGFAAQISDLFDRVEPGGDGLKAETDFSGIPHELLVLAFGSAGAVKTYVLIAYRTGEGA